MASKVQRKMTVKKNMAMSIGCLVMAGMLGCAYEPYDDFPDYASYELGYPIRESPQYALAPNTRWSSLHYYYDGTPWGPFLDMWIFLDSHRIQFTQVEREKESPKISHNRIATADEWRWIAGQLEEAGFSRWKTSYQPGGGFGVLDGAAWYLEFLDGSNVVGKVHGYNAGPKDFDAFQAILDAFDAAQMGSCVVFPKTTEEKAASPHREMAVTRDALPSTVRRRDGGSQCGRAAARPSRGGGAYMRQMSDLAGGIV